MFSAILAAALAFDSDLNEEQQNKLGLAKLSIQERAALRDWVEEHYTQRDIAQNSKKGGPLLVEVLKSGKFIRLSDDSLWEIDPKDTPITQSWITPNEIKIGKKSNGEYPYTLTNRLTGSTVKAKEAKEVH